MKAPTGSTSGRKMYSRNTDFADIIKVVSIESSDDEYWQVVTLHYGASP